MESFHNVYAPPYRILGAQEHFTLSRDDNATCDELSIGLFVPQFLRADTKTLPEDDILALDGTDYSSIGMPVTEVGQIVHRLIERLNRVPIDHMDSTPSVNSNRSTENYFTARAEEDSFPKPSLLGLIDDHQHEEIKSALGKMKNSAQANGLSKKNRPVLAKVLAYSMTFFRTSFLLGPPAKVPPLKIALTADTKPSKIWLRD